MLYILLIFQRLFSFPRFLSYFIYDKLIAFKFIWKKRFNGWGIHLYTGRFGAGKSAFMVSDAYKLCKKYPQLSIVTNIKLINFPAYTNILPLNNALDILNAPHDSLVLIDEIGTIFNSRDFSSGKAAVPKPLYQHLCQCRKRRMMILATVQKYNLLDKQIRDVSADVTSCSTWMKHPYSRMMTAKTYDIDEYDMYTANRTYKPILDYARIKIQRNIYRNLYDTSELVQGMLQKEYLSDDEILKNQADSSSITALDKQQRKSIKKRLRI